jgi:glycosyltransferase involved in cell wall biosynthesis
MVPRPAKLDPRVLLRTISGRSYSISRHLSEELRATLRRAVREFRPDVAQAETFVMGSYLSELRSVPTVLHMHDVAWIMWERMARVVPRYLRPLVAIEARRIRRDELNACRHATVCVNVSEIDRQRLSAATGPTVRTTVLVPGVDCVALTPVERSASTANLVFVGSMNYIPNVDAVEYFVREVLPLIAADVPDVSLTIVGARPGASVQRLAANPRVQVTGLVDDVRPYYADAAAAVVPLRMAGGVRMKILEAMALGCPVVSTTIGAEGLGLRDGQELLLADTPPQLAAAATRLLRDPGLRDRLASQARATALHRFSWDAVGRRLEGVYESIVRQA